MIQRVQSFYLLLVLASFVILTLGTDVFTVVVKEKDQFEMTSHGNVYGVQKDIFLKGELTDKNLQSLRSTTEKVDIEKEMKGISTYSFPFYIITILLSLLTILVIMGYKNLNRQQHLSRLLFILNLILFGTSIVLYKSMENSVLAIFDEDKTAVQLGLGFYCIAIALAFSFLALLGIRRDVKIISSINRLR